jgi:hypothetical protein
MMVKFPPTAAAVPEGPLREHAVKVEALVLQVVGMLNASGAETSVVLDVLLNVYMNAAVSYGRQVECAHHMAQIAGQVLLQDGALQQRAAGIEPGTPPTRH